MIHKEEKEELKNIIIGFMETFSDEEKEKLAKARKDFQRAVNYLRSKRKL